MIHIRLKKVSASPLNRRTGNCRWSYSANWNVGNCRRYSGISHQEPLRSQRTTLHLKNENVGIGSDIKEGDHVKSSTLFFNMIISLSLFEPFAYFRALPIIAPP
jgi:hypothetical protein